MIQVLPHWHHLFVWTVAINELFNELPGVEHSFGFAGPGFYLTDTDTILIVCSLPTDTPWRKNQPAEMTYDVFVWNCSCNETIFGGGFIPTRRDDRS